MASTTKTKAAERFANLQRRDQAVRLDIATADRLRSEKVARLREMRLAKEAQEAEAKKKVSVAKQETGEKQPVKKLRVRAAAE